MTALSFGCRSLVCATLLAFASVTVMPMSAFAKPPKGKKATTGELLVFALVQGATVEIDGRAIGKTPLPGPIELTPGTHTIRVFTRGHTEAVDELTITAGESTEYEPSLIAIAGVVRITANVAGATVAIDGKAAGSLPFDEDVPAGKHEFLVQAPGHKPFTQSVDLEGGKGFDLAVVLEAATEYAGPGELPEETPVYKKWWFWTIIGAVAVGATATGLVLGLDKGDEVAPADAVIPLP